MEVKEEKETVKDKWKSKRRRRKRRKRNNRES
jgi:hypothetical protein